MINRRRSGVRGTPAKVNANAGLAVSEGVNSASVSDGSHESVYLGPFYVLTPFRTGEWTPRGNLTIDNPGATSVPPVIVQGGTSGAVHLDCGGSRSISETVLFPVLPSQRQGIEDMRLVRFVDDDGSAIYHGTYTAFSGAEARSELLTTRDFKSFEMRAITGDVASAKGMALFPRRIDGRYVTLGRQDNKNIWLNVSSDLLHWDSGSKLIEPRYPWEFVQMGNCGSPIEVDEGWLVLTHGVGTVRNYCIGACLLDKADPSKLLARTPRPCSHPVPTSGTATFPTSSIAAERLCRTGPCYCPTPSPTASPRSDRCRSMICSPAWNRDRPRHLSVPAHLRSLTEVHMADNKTKTDGRDRSRVSGSEPYEVEYFAQKHGLNAQQARDLIAQVGNDSEKLDAAAEKLTGRRGQN